MPRLSYNANRTNKNKLEPPPIETGSKEIAKTCGVCDRVPVAIDGKRPEGGFVTITAGSHAGENYLVCSFIRRGISPTDIFDCNVKFILTFIEIRRVR